MIIVEGPDGAGKTTLIDNWLTDSAMVDRFGLPAPFRDGERITKDRESFPDLGELLVNETLSALSYELPVMWPELVWDRLFISEVVYSHVLGRQCGFSLAQQSYVWRLLGSMHVLVIIVLPPLHELVLDDQPPWVHDVAEPLHMNYRSIGRLLRHHHVDHVYFDRTQRKAYDRLEGRIKQHVRSRLDTGGIK